MTKTATWTLWITCKTTLFISHYIFQLPGLFDGCQFFFNGEFIPPQPSKEDLVQLVKYGGGRILSREPKPDIDESLCLPRTPESNKASVTLAPVAYHANPDTKHYRCTQFIIYDSLAEKKPHIWDTGSVCSMPSTWLMDCASNFQILTLEWDCNACMVFIDFIRQNRSDDSSATAQNSPAKFW